MAQVPDVIPCDPNPPVCNANGTRYDPGGPPTTGTQIPDRLGAGARRHVQVEHHDLRPMALHLLGERVQVVGLGEDVDVGLAFQQLAQPAAHERVVVGEHYADARSDSGAVELRAPVGGEAQVRL